MAILAVGHRLLPQHLALQSRLHDLITPVHIVARDMDSDVAASEPVTICWCSSNGNVCNPSESEPSPD